MSPLLLMVSTVVAQAPHATLAPSVAAHLPAFPHPETRSVQAAELLQAAVSTAAWLESNRALANGDRLVPDEVGADDPVFSFDLGRGAAGRGSFLLDLFAVTGRRDHLRSALLEVDAAIRGARAALTDGPWGLYDGVAGVAFVTARAHRITGINRYREAVDELTAALVAASRHSDSGVRWNEADDVIAGTAGIGLALLGLHRVYGDSGALAATTLQAATAAAETLLAAAEPVGDGTRWMRGPETPLDLPNFSHGTAGIAYFLAAAYAATGHPAFLDAAERGARYLLDIDADPGDLLLIPYGVPNDGYATRFDVGWAHGAAGSARLFFRLWQLTGRAEYRDATLACARTLLASGLPGDSANPELWAGPFRLDRRFGIAGTVRFLLAAGALGESPEFAARAGAVGDRIRHASRPSGSGQHWLLPRYGFQGREGELGAFSGYFYGAAGLAWTLLDLHRHLMGAGHGFRLPDDPF